MSESAKRRGPLFYALLTVVVGVWGLVIYNAARGVRAADAVVADPVSRPLVDTPLISTEVSLRYAPGRRDPFLPPPELFVPPEPAGESSADSVAIRERPTLVLTGVVGGTALLRAEDSTVALARAGESVGALRVLSVEAESIQVEFQEERFTLVLQQ